MLIIECRNLVISLIYSNKYLHNTIGTCVGKVLSKRKLLTVSCEKKCVKSLQNHIICKHCKQCLFSYIV